ncbi:MAG: NAD-dependent epimerase/dehydratase family protein, partial [Syntrophales bacterium]
MALTTQKILVTGADGFIGSHLVEALLARKYGDILPQESGDMTQIRQNLGSCPQIPSPQIRAFVHYNSFNSYGWFHCDCRNT